MLEIEKWTIQNNPKFFLEQLTNRNQESRNLAQNIENIKQAELELLDILKSNQTQPEEELT